MNRERFAGGRQRFLAFAVPPESDSRGVAPPHPRINELDKNHALRLESNASIRRSYNRTSTIARCAAGRSEVPESVGAPSIYLLGDEIEVCSSVQKKEQTIREITDKTSFPIIRPCKRPLHNR